MEGEATSDQLKMEADANSALWLSLEAAKLDVTSQVSSAPPSARAANEKQQQLALEQTSQLSTFLVSLSDSLAQNVNFKSVRKMIAQNLIEFLFICVIVAYLIYYFSQISKVS